MRKLPDDYEDRLRLKLSPERIRSTLSFAGLVLIVYEMAKQAVIVDVREFYSRGFDESGMLYDEEAYSRDVKSLDRSVYRASAKWLAKSGAITEEQIDVLERLQYTVRTLLMSCLSISLTLSTTRMQTYFLKP